MSKNKKAKVRIRMYRQGLGDCFLLTFTPTGSEEVNMLVDCGLLQGTKNAKAIMGHVASDIRDTISKVKKTGGEEKKYLDHVLLTHEHFDHTSGFSWAKDIFDTLHFGQVWTSWLDDRRHPDYRAVRERFRNQILGLTATLTAMTTENTLAVRETISSILDDFFDPHLLGAGTDLEVRSPAWDFALGKSVLAPRFCIPGKSFTIRGLDGFRFYVLGPPEDYNSFTSVHPPADETYRADGSKFAIADSFFSAVCNRPDCFDPELCQPFESHHRISQEEASQVVYDSKAREAATSETEAVGYPKYPFFHEHYGFEASSPNEWRRIGEDWLMAAGSLALNLDNYTNNTCLAVAIEFVESGKVMLFPGDAQFANWRSWQKLVFQVPSSNGSKRTVTFDDLLSRTVFYKVGHHGSHNATLRTNGLEKMVHPELFAMIPVDREMAKSKVSKSNPHGWEMPEPNLFNRLIERSRGRVILADEPNKKNLEKRCDDRDFVNRVKFGGKFDPVRTGRSSRDPLYVQCEIEDD